MSEKALALSVSHAQADLCYLPLFSSSSDVEVLREPDLRVRWVADLSEVTEPLCRKPEVARARPVAERNRERV